MPDKKATTVELTKYEPKLVSLPGSSVSPEVSLHRTLNKLDRIKAVAVIIQWDDGTFNCDWSTFKISELCMAAKVFSMEVEDEIRRQSNG